MNSRRRGFSLIEWMMVVTLVTILAALAGPSFRDLIAGQRIKTASYDLVTALSMARSEAIKRNANVTVIKETGGWQNRWWIYFGSSSTTNFVARQQAYGGLAMSDPGDVVYGRTGRITSGAKQRFQISSSVVTSLTARCVSIDLSGLAASKAGNCS